MSIRGTADKIGCVGPLYVRLEIKTDDGVLEPLQSYKIERVKNCGAIALVVKPSNLDATIKFLTNLSKQIKETPNDKANVQTTKLC